MGHARLSPSESHRWINCPGSVAATEDLPNSSSAAATLGTGAHALGAGILAGMYDEYFDDNLTWIGMEFEFEDERDGKKVFRKITVDQEMMDAVDVYLDAIRELTAEGVGPAGVMLECEVSLKHIHPDVKGTSDCIIDLSNLVPPRLVVIDYKHGFTPVHLVKAGGEVNTQLMTYAEGALEKLDPKREKFVLVELMIVQPRCREVASVQSHVMPAENVSFWAENDLKKAAHRTDEPDAELAAGEHCKWCPMATRNCPAWNQMTLEVANADFAEEADETTLPQVSCMTIEQLERALKWAPLLDAWVREISERAFEELQAGQKIDGFKLVQKRAVRKWPSEDDNKVAQLLYEAGLKDVEGIYAPKKLLSPAQIEKKFGKKKVEKIIAKVAIKPQGGYTMAAESDPKPRVQIKGAVDDFAELEEEDA